MLFCGDNIAPVIAILAPSAADSLSYDQGKLFVVSMSKDAGSTLMVSTQWSVTKTIAVGSTTEKENFPKEFYKLFVPNSTIQSLVYTYKFFLGFSRPETLAFAYEDTLSIRAFWQKPEFAEIVKRIQRNDVQEILLQVRGWRDTTYSAIYDDPQNDSRTLYKVHVQLIPGSNIIYFSGGKNTTSAIAYSTVYSTEYEPVESKTSHFHGSALEQQCSTCHEGLPNGDEKQSMTANCPVCHTEKLSGRYLHTPVELKECFSCHSWSVEKKFVVVDQGVPDKCYTCHSDISDTVTHANVPHPVVTECLRCHSPHGTDQPHLLKQDVYSLCIVCHEDKNINHPVGRHPLRFVKFGEGDEELSCVSCHTPHGSSNDKLLKVGGGSLAICVQCH
jgi:predicted CXXCH cytochrome family protein